MIEKLSATPLPPFTRVTTRLSPRDHLGAWAVRWGIGRSKFRVEPGLYAVGQPGPDAPVMISCNYKMSFDLLRQALTELNAWIVVLDTKGVNVWCAAGKGSFGTKELVQRLASVRLKEVITHRQIIVPQLGAVGVSAPVVAAFSGFKVSFGPVRAADIPAWLAAKRQKTPAMSRVRFGLLDRLVLIPVELVQVLWLLPVLILLAFGLALPLDGQFAARAAWLLTVLVGAVPVATVAFPLLLPALPGRAFAVKGLVLGTVWVVAAATLAWWGFGGQTVWNAAPLDTALTHISGALLALPIIVYLAMNFTGCTTFTCQTGANLEVERAIIPLISAAGLGLLIGITRLILQLAGLL